MARPAGPYVSEVSLLVLIALSTGSKHGYAIQTDIAAFSGLDLGPGTLYVALPRLERAGLIEPLASDGRRRPYQLTDAGRQVLDVEIARAETLAAVARQRLEAARRWA